VCIPVRPQFGQCTCMFTAVPSSAISTGRSASMSRAVLHTGQKAVPSLLYVTKSIAPESRVVQDGILNAKIAGVPVSKAFPEITWGDVQLGKKHTQSGRKALLFLLRQVVMHLGVLGRPRLEQGLVVDMPY